MHRLLQFAPSRNQPCCPGAQPRCPGAQPRCSGAQPRCSGAQPRCPGATPRSRVFPGKPVLSTGADSFIVRVAERPLYFARRRTRPLRWATLFTLRALPASAAVLRDCKTAASPLNCRLDTFLHALYLVAMLLGIVLVAVVWLAVRLYRKSKSTQRNGE